MPPKRLSKRRGFRARVVSQEGDDGREILGLTPSLMTRDRPLDARAARLLNAAVTKMALSARALTIAFVNSRERSRTSRRS